MAKSIEQIKTKLLSGVSRRLLLSSGLPPIPYLVNKLITSFSRFTEYGTASTPKEFRNNTIVNSIDVINTAKELAYDTDTLQEWSDTYQKDTSLFSTFINNRMSFVESRINEFSNKSVKTLNFNLLSNINTVKSSVDFNSKSGRYGDGESVLSIANPEKCLKEYSISSVIYSNDSIPQDNKSIKAITPSGSNGYIDIIIVTEDRSSNAIIIDTITDCSVNVYTSSVLSSQEDTWTLLTSGESLSTSKSIIRFIRTENKYLKIRLLNPKSNIAENGNLLGLVSLQLVDFNYIKQGNVITKSISDNKVKGYEVTVTSTVPENTTITLQGSFESDSSGFSDAYSLTTASQSFIFNSIPNHQEYLVSSVIQETQRLFSLPVAVQSESHVEVYYGLDQFKFSSRSVNTTETDSALDMPNQGSNISPVVFVTPQSLLQGSIELASTYSSITGSTTILGPLFTNIGSYGTDSNSEHMVVMFYDGVKKYLVPGREYVLSCSVYCDKDIAQIVSTSVPGGNWQGGTLPHQLLINGKAVLTVTSQSLLNVNNWVYSQSSISLTAGWNTIQLVINVPNRSIELNPSLYSALRVSFNPLSSTYRDMYRLSAVRAVKDSLREVDLFSMQSNHPIKDLDIFSRKKISDTQYSVVLNNSYRHQDFVTTDGNIHGQPTRFLVSETSISLCNGFWLLASLSGTKENTPEIHSISYKVIQ